MLEPGALLDWEGCFNARDVGGYPTADGRRMRRGALLRSDLIGRLTERGHQQMLACGVRTIVDLRGEYEHRVDPSPYATHTHADASPRYVPAPLIDEGDVDTVNRLNWTRARYGANYCVLLDGFRRQVATILTTIADAPEGGVLVHCFAGKDRTGVIVGVLLALAGVSTETIVADYALSERHLWDRWESLRGGDTSLPPPHAPPEAMAEVLAWLEREQGGAVAYVRSLGLSDEQVARLMERLVE